MKRSSLIRIETLAILTALAVSLAPLSAAEIVVNSFADRGDAVPGDGTCAAVGIDKCTLRAAVQEANALAGSDRINLPAGRFTLSLAGTGEDAAATGDLDILEALNILGQGADETVIDAAGLDRVFHVHAGVSPLLLQMLTVTGGSALDDPPAPAGMGGGILADQSSVHLYRSRVEGNSAYVGGGVAGWYALEVRIEQSELIGNEIQTSRDVTSLGGALYFENNLPGIVEVLSSTVADNGCLTQSALECHGGIAVPLSAFGTTTDPEGLFVVNSTISGNEGHGLFVGQSNAFLVHATVYGNTGWGLFVDDDGRIYHTTSAGWSTLAGNGIADCFLAEGSWLIAGRNNLSSDASCTLDPGELFDTDPDLYPFGYYTPLSPRIARSHHPRWGSPVVGGAPTSPFPEDQDGESRTAGSADIGSIEVLACGKFTPVDYVLSYTTLTTGTYEACNTITADPNVIVNGTVTFEARDSVSIGNGFEITPGSEFSVSIHRYAGVP